VGRGSNADGHVVLKVLARDRQIHHQVLLHSAQRSRRSEDFTAASAVAISRCVLIRAGLHCDNSAEGDSIFRFKFAYSDKQFGRISRTSSTATIPSS
jgi:hypothetical protein